MKLLIPDVKSDKEIYQEALNEWTGVLVQLWDAIGKPVDRKQLQVYAKQLNDVPLGLLEQALKALMRRHTYNTVPTIGEIWQEVKKLEGDWYVNESNYWGVDLQLGAA
jgi:hypothetical protein